MSWEAVIGLEVHVQLQTRSKIFSGAPTEFGAPPNTQACAVDLGLPGVLPVMNENAARMAVKLGLAIVGAINRRSVFARKNYFYPDLPKGYQISQYALPIVGSGFLDIDVDGRCKRIRITRAHLEEDAGKSLHEDFHGMTGIDLNRAGTPLIEIVSEPDMRSADEAVAYLRKLHTLVQYLEISDGNMQEGSFRCDANVSVRQAGDQQLGTRTELKNLNSFRFIERAIEHEIARHIEILGEGGQITQETRLYDPDQDETRPMRGKEEAHDYRYFPDPDLPPMVIDDPFIDAVRLTLPEMPDARERRFREQYNLNDDQAHLLIRSRPVADYFEAVATTTRGAPGAVANWIAGDLTSRLNEENIPISRSPVPPEALAGLIDRIADGTISGKIAKQVFRAMWDGEGNADRIIDTKGLRQITDSSEIEHIIDEVLARSGPQLEQYRGGHQKVFGYFIGQIMNATAGKANPRQVNDLLKKKLDT